MINLTIKRLLYPSTSISTAQKNTFTFLPPFVLTIHIPIFERKNIFPWKSKKKSQDLFLDLIVWLVFFFFDMFSLCPLETCPWTTQETDTNSIELKTWEENGKRNTRNRKLLFALVNPSLGKYSIKKLSNWTFIFSLEILSLWNFH